MCMESGFTFCSCAQRSTNPATTSPGRVKGWRNEPGRQLYASLKISPCPLKPHPGRAGRGRKATKRRPPLPRHNIPGTVCEIFPCPPPPCPPRLTLEEQEGAEAFADGHPRLPPRHEEVHGGLQPAAGEDGRPDRGAVHGRVVLRQLSGKMAGGGHGGSRVGRAREEKSTPGWRKSRCAIKLSPLPPSLSRAHTRGGVVSRTMNPTSVMAAAWPAPPPPRRRPTSSPTRSSASPVRSAGAVSGMRLHSSPAGMAPSEKPSGAARSSARSRCVHRTAPPALPLRRAAAPGSPPHPPPSHARGASPWPPRRVRLSQLPRRPLTTCLVNQVKSWCARSGTQPRFESSGRCVVTEGGGGDDRLL